MRRTNCPVLFRVLLEKVRNELEPDFIDYAAKRTRNCVHDLLAVAGYHGLLFSTVGQSGTEWHLTLHVEKRLLTQLDLFSSKGELPTVAQASKALIEAAVVAIARFRRETGGINAAALQDTLKKLKSADPRVIAALARQPGGKLAIRQEDRDLELSIQSDSHRPVSLETETLQCVIVAAGFTEMSVLPCNKKSAAHMCLHTMRIKISKELRAKFNPHAVLEDFVRPKARIQLLVQPEVVARKRQYVTCLLAEWPPTQREKQSAGVAIGLPSIDSVLDDST